MASSYQFLPCLVKLLLEHYLQSIFTLSSQTAIGTLFTTNILPCLILLLEHYSKTPHKRTSGLSTTSLKFRQSKEPLQADKSNWFLQILVKLLAEVGANHVLGRKQNTVILPAGIVFQQRIVVHHDNDDHPLFVAEIPLHETVINMHTTKIIEVILL